MRLARDKYVVVGADFCGLPLKDAVKAHLAIRGWTVDDLTPTLDSTLMYHRVGFLVGSRIAEGMYEKALVFDGTGMGSHIAASKCPHVHAAVAETIQAARRAATANGANLLAMGALWTAPPLACAMADAFLEGYLGNGYERWEGFYDYHELGYRECDAFDYEAFRGNGFSVPNAGEPWLGPEPPGLSF
ncbi:Galactose-6-phosphate isomerase subunit LacA [Propionicimonas sp. T2.31MG-18]|uniref:RpiB/LacA/LacB family sugar-phosphate isomerase n=1 Tax=Propionicimonas sp. T2.31MG-18 TaxID=3157620 RepID=UPI0035ED0DA5